jgi:hypothetical protein
MVPHIHPGSGAKAPRIRDVFRQLLRTYSWGVFYRGFSLTLMRSIPVSCTTLPMFDTVHMHLSKFLAPL